MLVLGYGLAVMVGLSLGLLGSGGAIFATPIFVYIWHFPDKQALASSFVIVVIVGLLSIWRHMRAGNINVKIVCLFAPMTMFGAHLGSKIAISLSGSTQLVFLSIMMLSAAGFMVREMIWPRAVTPNDACERDGLALHWLIFAGFLVGIMVGCVGIGGGFIIVPLLLGFARIPLTEAIGTALFIAVLNSAVGSYEHLKYVEIPWAPVLAFASLAAMGGIAGTMLIKHVPLRALKAMFIVALIFAASLLFYDNRQGLDPMMILSRSFTQHVFDLAEHSTLR